MVEIDALERTDPFGSTGLRRNCWVGEVYLQGTHGFCCLPPACQSPWVLSLNVRRSATFHVLSCFNIQLSVSDNKFLLFFKCLHFHTEQSIKASWEKNGSDSSDWKWLLVAPGGRRWLSRKEGWLIGDVCTCKQTGWEICYLCPNLEMFLLLGSFQAPEIKCKKDTGGQLKLHNDLEISPNRAIVWHHIKVKG